MNINTIKKMSYEIKQAMICICHAQTPKNANKHLKKINSNSFNFPFESSAFLISIRIAGITAK